ncbi:hypothetical protein [uncultured Polaribacter sp.]|uniref:hypothetical protein n=1 Tax=uncultured Polaribacter sp. TaxID=174711 RepID=UPI002614B1CA|nr:hypothetical protein [uncultured Polaribacter sp.]
MINQLTEKYPNLTSDSCHETLKDSFFIKDTLNGKCLTSLNSEGATCFVENTNDEQIIFVAVDACLIKDTTIKKCDTLVTKNKIIWFIELKEIIQSGTRKKFIKRKKNHRKKALKQIASTINDFKSKGIDFSGYFVAGLICFPPFPSIALPTNIPTTSSQVRILEFQKICGYTELHEGNYISL